MMDAFELPTTLAQALQQRAALTPERVALRFLAEDEQDNVVLSYRDLDARARTIAAALQAQATLSCSRHGSVRTRSGLPPVAWTRPGAMPN